MSPSPEKMTASEVDLLSKCLELSQALRSQGPSFKLSIKLGNFSFSLDSKETTPKEVDKKKKKLSPSQIKRNLKRKEEFLKKKSNPLKETSDESKSEDEVCFKCNHCDKTFRTEHGLKIHKGKSHETEILRSTPEGSPLKESPVKGAPREEPCVCCGDLMSPEHQCEEAYTPEAQKKCLYCHEVVSLDHQCDTYQCGGCAEAFSNEDDLTAHENNEHPFMCIICFNNFKDKDSKRKHTREKHQIPKL